MGVFARELCALPKLGECDKVDLHNLSRRTAVRVQSVETAVLCSKSL